MPESVVLYDAAVYLRWLDAAGREQWRGPMGSRSDAESWARAMRASPRTYPFAEVLDWSPAVETRFDRWLLKNILDGSEEATVQ